MKNLLTIGIIAALGFMGYRKYQDFRSGQKETFEEPAAPAPEPFGHGK